MYNTALREAIDRLLPRVQMPAQYIGVCLPRWMREA